MIKIECIDFLIWIGTPKKRSVTVKEVGGEKKLVYKPARYSSIKGYIKEAMELGCCRRIPQLPYWAVPGKSQVFLVHRGHHKRPDRGSIFGYYVLKRIEFIAHQEGPDPIEQYRGKSPWSDVYREEFEERVASCRGAGNAEACIRNKYPKKLKDNLLRDVCRGEIKRGKIKRGEIEFNGRPSRRYKDPFEKLLDEILEEFMKKCWEKILERMKNDDYAPVPQELADGGGGMGCSKRKDPGAAYLVNALYSEIIDAYHKKFYHWLEHEGRREHPGASRGKLIKELKATESKIIYPEEGNKLFREVKREVLVSRKPKAGELVLFDEPYPIFQHSPHAAFRGYLHIDGDELLKQINKGGKAVTPIIPYCNGSGIEPGKPMTKAQLVTHLVAKVGLQRAVANRFLRQLSELVPDELNRTEAITLPGLGKMVLSERKARQGINPRTRKKIQIPAKKVIKFRPAKGLKDKI